MTYPAASSNSGRTASPRGSKNGSGGKAGSRLGPEGIEALSPSSIVTPIDEATDNLDPVEGITEVERKLTAGTLTIVPTPCAEAETERVLPPPIPALEYPDVEVLLIVAEEV